MVYDIGRRRDFCVWGAAKQLFRERRMPMVNEVAPLTGPYYLGLDAFWKAG